MSPSGGKHRRFLTRGGWMWVLPFVWLTLAWGPSGLGYAQEPPPPVETDEAETEPVEGEEADGVVEDPAEQPEPDDQDAEAEVNGDAEADLEDEPEAEADDHPDAQGGDEPDSEPGEEPGADEPDEADEVGAVEDTDLDTPGEVEPPEGDQPPPDQEVEADSPAEPEEGEPDEPPPDEEAADDAGAGEEPSGEPEAEVSPDQAKQRRPLSERDRLEARRRMIEEREERRRARRDKSRISKPPRRTPSREPDKSSETESRDRDRKDRAEKKPDRGAPETVVDIDLDIEEPDFAVPPEQREYQFSFEEVEYADLLDAFSRMSGLAVIGDPPKGKVTFKTTEVMDFKEAFNRIRFLLFRHRDVYWLQRGATGLEVLLVNEVTRDLDLKDFYSSVADLRAADRDETDLIMLLYTPEKGSVDDLMITRDFLPDYVRMAPLDDPTQNKMTVFALVKDINKFLDLVDIFTSDDDPRAIKKVPVIHVTPTAAVEALGELMDLSDGRSPRPSRTKGTAPSPGPIREIKLLPDDAQKIILVRALPSDIEEIERLLPYIDVELDQPFNPVIITLKYVSTEEVMAGLTPLLNATTKSAPQAQPSSKKKPRRPSPARRRRGAASSVASASTDDVTVVPEPRTNRLIVLGSDEGVARVRQIVAMLDVESELDRPTVVILEHADAAETATKVTRMMAQVRPTSGSARPFTATPDEPSNSLLLSGSALDRQLALELIESWDVIEAIPTLHKARLEYAKASEVATWLFRLESGTPQRTPPRAKTRAKKGRKSTPARSTRGAAGPSGQFFGDDALNTVYVICTEHEWNTEYLPMIEQFDQDAKPAPLGKHQVAVTKAEPATVIETVTLVLSADGSDVPQMVPVPDGILVIDANADQIDRIESLVSEVDVDPLADRERRVFEIEHADPNQVRESVLAMISSSPKATPRRASTSSRKGAKRARRPARSPATVDRVKMVPSAQRLIVTAPADRMAEIADLIALLDVDTEETTEVRIYPFPTGVNVQDLANTLSRLSGGQTVTRGKPAAKGQPKGRSRRPTPTGGPADVTFIAQPTQHRILVSAPVEEFEEIERLIQLLGTHPDVVETVYDFIEVNEGNADTLVQLIQPMLQAKLAAWIESGDIPQPQAGPKGKARTQGLLTIQPDPRGDRIVIAAPQLLVAEARALVAELDRPVEDGERVIRTIILEKSDAQEMSNTIRAMLTGQQPRPVRTPRGKGRPKGKIAPMPPTGGGLDVMVTPAPGGGALVLAGPAKHVEEVEGWIKTIEEGAVGSSKIIKIYDLKDADVEQVADTLMAVVDTGPAPRGAPKGKSRTSKDEGLLDDIFGAFSTQVTRQGKDLYISADTFTGTMMVAAAPAKMREVDDIVKMFVGDEETGEGPLIPKQEVLPYMTYELTSTDAFDAVYTLESFLAVLWPYEDVPQVEYIPFTNILVVKGNPEHFDEVEKLIAEYVDTGTGKPAISREVIPTSGVGMTARQTALMLKGRLEDMGIEVDIESLNPPEPGELEEIQPCVLPASAFAAVRAAVASVVGQEADDQTDQQDELEPEAQPQPEEPAHPKPKLRIIFDDKGGKLVLEGAGSAIDDADELIKSMKEELKDVPALPDIRIYRLKYVSVAKAAAILDQMFNERQRRAQQQRMQALQRQLRQQQRRQRQQPGGRQQGERGERGERGQQPPGAPGQQPQIEMPQQQMEMGVTVYPNPRDRTIIIKAATEAFPSIVSLLKKIDKPSQAPMDYKIFTLKTLVASEVEEQLKAMLGQQSRGGRQRAPSRRDGQRRAGGPQATQDDLLLMGAGGEGSSIAAEEITISANAATNSIMVMAPQEAMELVERFINDMEALGHSETVVDYPLVNADAVQVAKTLQAVFGKQGSRAPKGAGGLAVTVVGDTESNTVFVSAPEQAHQEIAALIDKMEKAALESIKPRVIKVTMGTPSDIAAKITEAMGATSKGRKQSRIKITGDDVGKQLLVVAPDEMLPEIQSLVGLLDKAPESLNIRIYPLEHAQATEVLQGLNQMVRQAMNQLPRGVKADMFSATADERSNSLVVMGGPMTFMLVEKVLKDIDIPPRDPTQIVTRIYQLKNSQAADLARTINNIYKDEKKRKGVDPPRAEANPSTNSLTVRGTKRQVEEIDEQVIKPHEEQFAGQIREVIKLENARAADVANVINQTLRSSRQGRGGQPPVTVVANDPLNSLVVSGTQAEYDAIVPLIQQLDHKPEEMLGLVVEVYQLKYADPGSTIGTITNSFPRLPGQKPDDTVRASYAWGTSALVVAASPDNQVKVRELLEKVDVESTTGRSVHIVELQHANADELAHKLGEVYSRSRRRQRDQQPISFTSEPGTNSLLVYASEPEMEQIGPMIQSLDVKPEFERDRTFKSFQLTYAECWEVKGLIDETFRPRRGKTMNPRDTVTTMAAQASNSIVVSAAPEKMDQVAKLIAEVDKKDAAMRDVHVLTIKHADPAAVNRSLNDIFARSTQSRRGQTIFISNPQGSDTLLIKANDKEFAEIQQVVEQIDTSEAEVGGEIKVIPLKYTDAGETLEIVREYLRKPGRGGRQAELAGDIRVSAATATNSLVISGDTEEIEHLEGIIARIDVEMEDDPRAPRIIKLQHANAAELEQSLNELFGEQRGGRGRRGSRGGGGTALAPVIVADTNSNSLVVRASGVDFKRIEELVAGLDVEDGGGAPRIIALKHAQASDLEPKLTSLFAEQRRGRGGRRGGPQTMTPVIVADDGANVLLVRAEAVDFAQIEDLVARLDTEDAAVGTDMRILPLKVGIDAEEMALKLDDILEQQLRNMPGGGRGRRGAGTQPQRVMVFADARSNSLILSGPRSKFAEVERIVSELEELGPAGGMVSTVIRLNNADPEDIQQLLDQVVTESKGGTTSKRKRSSQPRRRR